jgi:hypothetical protein
MGCNCNKGRQQFEVVADGGAGKVLYTASVESTAQTVSQRYPGSIVRPQGQATPAGTKTTEAASS